MVRLPSTDSNNFISLHLCSLTTLSDWSRQTQHLGCILVTDGTRHNDVVGHALCDAAGAEDVIARPKATKKYIVSQSTLHTRQQPRDEQHLHAIGHVPLAHGACYAILVQDW